MEQYCFQQFCCCVTTGLRRLKAFQAAEKPVATATHGFKLGLFFSVLLRACLKVGAHHRIKLYNLQQKVIAHLGQAQLCLFTLRRVNKEVMLSYRSVNYTTLYAFWASTAFQSCSKTTRQQTSPSAPSTRQIVIRQ